MEVPIPRFCPGGPIVILSQERGFLKSQELFGALREAVVRAGKKGQRLDEVEQEAQAETPQRSGLSDGWRERLRERRNAATARHTPSQRRLQTFQHQLLPEPSDFRPTCTELLDQLLVQVGRPPLTFVRMKQRFGPQLLVRCRVIASNSARSSAVNRTTYFSTARYMVPLPGKGVQKAKFTAICYHVLIPTHCPTSVRVPRGFSSYGAFHVLADHPAVDSGRRRCAQG